MSYSRWTTSRWYTIWSAGFAESRDEAIFDVVAVKRFSALRIRTDIESCINHVRAADPRASDAELGELKGYMIEFLREVDEAYPQPITEDCQ